MQSHRTAIALGAARGAALLAAAERGLPIYEYAPRRVKQSVVGRGGADKSQVGFMVRALLGLTETPRPTRRTRWRSGSRTSGRRLARCAACRPTAANMNTRWLGRMRLRRRARAPGGAGGAQRSPTPQPDDVLLLLEHEARLHHRPHAGSIQLA